MTIEVCEKAGKRIRSLRDELGMSQETLADLSNITRSNLSRIETGDAEPCLITLVDIARALNMKVAELVKGID